MPHAHRALRLRNGGTRPFSPLSMEAIILAGGLGINWLRSVVHEAPKSMALIQSRPLSGVSVGSLDRQRHHTVRFFGGYKSDHIRRHFGNSYRGCEVVYAVEETNWERAGAIKNALPYITVGMCGWLTAILFFTDIQAQYRLHLDRGADATFTLKPMKNFARYGTLRIGENGRIQRFMEKQPTAEGLINGGVYLFNVAAFRALIYPKNSRSKKTCSKPR